MDRQDGGIPPYGPPAAAGGQAQHAAPLRLGLYLH